MLLLDTHAWLWIVDGDERRIGARTRRLIARAESGRGVGVSPVSVFEIAALHAGGRLRLARPPDQWVRTALGGVGTRLVELSADIALDAAAIPRTALADPLDRLLVATARQLDATMVTSDRAILTYASASGAVRVRDAAR